MLDLGDVSYQGLYFRSVFILQNDINIFFPPLWSLEHVTSRLSVASS